MNDVDRSVLHDSFHHLEHALNVVLDLHELTLGQTLTHGLVIDGRFHPKYLKLYNLQNMLNLATKSGPSFWYTFFKMMYNFSKAGRI